MSLILQSFKDQLELVVSCRTLLLMLLVVQEYVF